MLHSIRLFSIPAISRLFLQQHFCNCKVIFRWRLQPADSEKYRHIKTVCIVVGCARASLARRRRFQGRAEHIMQRWSAREHAHAVAALHCCQGVSSDVKSVTPETCSSSNLCHLLVNSKYSETPIWRTLTVSET